MHHIVYSRAVRGHLVRRTQKLRLLRALHGGARAAGAKVFERGGQQIQLEDELPHVLIFPDVEVYAGRLFDYLVDIGGVES